MQQMPETKRKSSSLPRVENHSWFLLKVTGVSIGK
jgi:hypothetical protein